VLILFKLKVSQKIDDDQEGKTHEGKIDLSTLKAGTYFSKLQAGEKSVTRKVVKY